MKVGKEKLLPVALYIRVSTQEQVRDGYSLDSQSKRLESYCLEKGYKIIKKYADEGKSARTKLKNRKALLQLTEDAQKGLFRRIIFWRLDRWFRDIKDYYKIQEILESCHVDWECSDEEYNTSTSNGRLLLNMKLSINQNESDQTGDRIRFNFEQMVKNGYPIYGAHCLPLGFQITGEKKNKKIIHDEQTEEIVYDMFDKLELFGSIRKTLFYINETYDLDIGYESMRKYMRNTLYYGSYRDNNAYCEPYLEKKRWDRIQQMIDKNKKYYPRHHTYLFSGLVKCPICGHNMTGFMHKVSGKEKHQYYYYRCNYHYNYKKCKNGKYINETLIESCLCATISRYLKEYTITVTNIKDKLEKKKTNHKVLEKKIERLNELYIEGKIKKEKYTTIYEKITSSINSIKNDDLKSRNLKKYYNILKKDSVTLYHKLTLDSKRTFWLHCIDFITLDQTGQLQVFFKRHS